MNLHAESSAKCLRKSKLELIGKTCACLFWISSATQAQQADIYVNDLFDTFEKICGLALMDPQAFLNQAKPNDVDGLPNSIRTEDGQILSVFSAEGRYVAAASFAALNAEYLVSCELIDYSGGKSSQTGNDLSRLVKNEMSKRNWRAIGGRLIDASTGNADLFGGDSHFFVASLPLPRHEPVVSVELVDDDILIRFENEIHSPK